MKFKANKCPAPAVHSSNNMSAAVSHFDDPDSMEHTVFISYVGTETPMAVDSPTVPEVEEAAEEIELDPSALPTSVENSTSALAVGAEEAIMAMGKSTPADSSAPTTDDVPATATAPATPSPSRKEKKSLKTANVAAVAKPTIKDDDKVPRTLSFFKKKQKKAISGEDADEKELKELERKVAILERKNQLMKKLNTIEKGDDAPRSPKKSRVSFGGILKTNKWKQQACCYYEDGEEDEGAEEEPFLDDEVSDDDNSQEEDRVYDLFTTLTEAFDCMDEAFHDIGAELMKCRQDLTEYGAPPVKDVPNAESEENQPADEKKEAVVDDSTPVESKAEDEGDDKKVSIDELVENAPESTTMEDEIVQSIASDSIKELPKSRPSEVERFKLMHVTITALALSGLTVESKQYVHEEDKKSVPRVQAVLSIARNTTTSQRSIYSHLPSLPVVRDPARSAGKQAGSKKNLLAVWPAENQDTVGEDEPGTPVSSVAFSRMITKANLGDDGEDNAQKVYDEFGPKVLAEQSSKDLDYIPSMVELRLCIKDELNSQILPVGVSRILISGEERDVEMTVPVLPEYYKSMKDLVKNKPEEDERPMSRWNSFLNFLCEDENDIRTSTRFKGAKKEKYQLATTSFLRIRLQTSSLPQVQHSSYPTINAGVSSKEYVPSGKHGQLSRALKKMAAVENSIVASKDSTVTEEANLEGESNTQSTESQDEFSCAINPLDENAIAMMEDSNEKKGGSSGKPADDDGGIEMMAPTAKSATTESPGCCVANCDNVGINVSQDENMNEELDGIEVGDLGVRPSDDEVLEI